MLGFSKLLKFFHTEPISMDLQARLVAEEHLIRNQQTRYKNHQGRIITAWEEYEAGAETVEEQLLMQVVAVHGPVITGSSRSLNVVCIRNVYGGLTFDSLVGVRYTVFANGTALMLVYCIIRTVICSVLK